MKYIMLRGLGQSSDSWSDTVKVFNDDFEAVSYTHLNTVCNAKKITKNAKYHVSIYAQLNVFKNGISEIRFYQLMQVYD